MIRTALFNSPIKLILPDRQVDLRPSPTEVYDGLRLAQKESEGVVILERDEDHYMKVTHKAGVGFTVQVRDGSDKRHFLSQIESLTIEISSSLMISYLFDGTDWEVMIQWRPYTSLSVRGPTVKRRPRARLIEKQGRYIFISRHWTLVGIGIICNLGVLLVFLVNPGNAFQNIDLAKSLAMMSTICFVMSIVVRD